MPHRGCPSPLVLGPRRGKRSGEVEQARFSTKLWPPMRQNTYPILGYRCRPFPEHICWSCGRVDCGQQWLTGACGGGGHSQKGGAPLNQALPPSPPCRAGSQLLWGGWPGCCLKHLGAQPGSTPPPRPEASTRMPLHLPVCLWSLCWAKDRTCCPGWQNPYSYRRKEPVPPVFRGGAPTAPASPPRLPFLLSLQGHEITARLTWHRTHIPPLVFTWPWMPWDPVSQPWIKRSVSECREAPSQGREAVSG